jgi:hypothetical protein
MAARPIELGWLYYLAALAALALLERVAAPEAAGLDVVLDAALNLGALLGLIALTAWSVLWFRAGGEGQRWARGARAVASAFVGPLVGLVVVTFLSQDVDGSTWMMAAPILGLLLVTAGLIVEAVVELVRDRVAG